MAEMEKNGNPEGVNVTKAVISQEPVQETENLHLKTRRRLIQVGLMSLPVLMTVSRITSYNVCYTKLLRTPATRR